MIEKEEKQLKDKKKKSIITKIIPINQYIKKSQDQSKNEINDLLINSCQSSRTRNRDLVTSLLCSSKNFIMSNQNFPKNKKNNFYIYPYNKNRLLKRYNSASPKSNYYNKSKNLLSRKNISINPRKKHEFSEKLINFDIKNNLNQFGDNISALVSPKKSYKESTKKEDENSYKYNMKNNINSHSFMNFIDNFNNNINIINKYNEYKEKYFVDKDNDNNKKYLISLFNEINFDENNINGYFNNDDHTIKKNKFQINDFNISIKLSSLTLYFYEISKISKKRFNSQKYIKNIFNTYHNDSDYDIKKLITKIRFPFEFLGFFYGINFEDFLKFLLYVIEYDYKNNKFFLNSNLANKIDYCRRVYYFYNNQSYFETFKKKKSKEYFKYHWDIKLSKMNYKNFILKIVLPKMNIDLKNENKKIKFYSCVETKRMGYFLRENFNEWDFYILNYFSEYKLFRSYSIKNLFDKYILSDSFKNKNTNKNNNLVFNLNNNSVISNSKKIDNNNTYSFFYSQIAFKEKENYLFKLKIPQINITYNQPNNKIHKIFELDIKRMSQLNKLRSSFHPKNLIKFGLIYIKENKKDIENKINIRKNFTKKSLKRCSSFHEGIGKVSTNKFINGRLNLNKLTIRGSNIEHGLKNNNKEKKELGIKDIKLNLDKYIFNFDEDILKFIKVKNDDTPEKIEVAKQNSDKHINKFNFNKERLSNSPNFDYNLKILNNQNLNNIVDEKQKLKIEIGTVELNWINQNSEKKHIIFDKKESEKFLDLPLLKWRFYIENNINNYISSRFSENKENNDESSPKTKHFKTHRVTRALSSIVGI